MVKGTASRGKFNKTQVVLCRRCGRRSYHLSKRRCAACGFGASPRIRRFRSQTKPVTRNFRLK